jgi:hypothetical protein
MRKLALTLLFMGILDMVSADTLTLRNGSTIVGTYMGGTAQTFRMQVGESVQTYSINDVESLTVGKSQLPRSAAAAPVTPAQETGSAAALTAATTAVNRRLPSGSSLTIPMIDAIDSAANQPGDTFRASLDEPIVEGDQTLVPRGADAVVKLVAEKESNKITGQPELTLELVSLQIGNNVVPIRSQSFTQAGASRTKRSAGVIGGGTALGAIIGAVAGGGKGAAVGAISGAGAGTAVQVLTKGAKVQVPSETRLTFTLQDPVRL